MSAMDTFRTYLQDVRQEFVKVSWPTREELRDSTAVVLVMVVLVAAFVGVVDRLLTFAVGLLFR